MEEYVIETDNGENPDNLYNISILDEEYEFSMKINESLLEFKLQQKNIDEYYYKSKYDLQTINKLLSSSFKGIKEVFDLFDKIIIEKKVKIIKLKDKNIINLILQNVKKNVEMKLELKKINLTKEELKKKLKLKNEKSFDELIEENNKQLKESIDQKIEESKQKYIKIFEEKIREKDNEINKLKETIEKLKLEYEKKLNEIQNKNQIKTLEIGYIDSILIGGYERPNNEVEYIDELMIVPLEKEPLIIDYMDSINLMYDKEIDRYTKSNLDNFQILSLKKEAKKNGVINFNMFDENDNVNLNNDFSNINIENIKISKVIVNNLKIAFMKSVAVYKIIRNNEISYEIAYPDNKNGYNIIIYNILNQKTNTIKNAHQNEINRIKHYYNSLDKYHILLTSSKDKSVKLWNISTDAFLNILHIPNCFNGNNLSPFCLMFNKDDYYIIGGTYFNKKNIWDKNGKLIGPIEQSQLKIGAFIEATYIDNKPYILLSGANHSEYYDYNTNNIKIYQSKKKNNQNWIANLFNKNNKIYLISGDYGGNVIIFDFITTNEISSINVGGDIYSLCSINEKYILVGNSIKELNVIDFDNKSIIKNYKEHNKAIYGIEKIKAIWNKEYIITYDENEVKLWE